MRLWNIQQLSRDLMAMTQRLDVARLQQTAQRLFVNYITSVPSLVLVTRLQSLPEAVQSSNIQRLNRGPEVTIQPLNVT